MWNDHVSGIRGCIPDFDLGGRGEVETHFLEYCARLSDDTCPIFQILIPARRQSNNRKRSARAKCATNHIVQLRRVFKCDKIAMMGRHVEA